MSEGTGARRKASGALAKLMPSAVAGTQAIV